MIERSQRLRERESSRAVRLENHRIEWKQLLHRRVARDDRLMTHPGDESGEQLQQLGLRLEDEDFGHGAV